MTDPEIIFTLWYVFHRDGFIYFLRGGLYVGVGSKDEKIEMLRHFAFIDYLIARQFPIPEGFYTHFAETGVTMPVAYRRVALDVNNTPLRLLEDAIKILNDEIPAQTKLEIPLLPIVCIPP